MKSSVWNKHNVKTVSSVLQNEPNPKFYEFLEAMETCQFWLLNENDTVSDQTIKSHFYACRNDFMILMIEDMVKKFTPDFRLTQRQKDILEREFLLHRSTHCASEVYRFFNDVNIPYNNCIALILANAASLTFFSIVKF